MKQRQFPDGIRQKSSRGFAAIVLVAMIALVGGYLIVGVLNQTGTEVRTEQDARTRDTLKEAKAALITYAASEAWDYGDYGTSNIQPGALPCPDTNNDGLAESTCTTAASRIGRLPWKTLRTSDLRDAAGESLWYGLSDNFRKAYSSTIINSDTAGTLTVNGMAPASNLVAVIIAPGQAVQDTASLPSVQIQDRSAANVNRAASYLEHTNYSGTDTYADAAPGANGVYNAAATTYNSLTQSRDFFNDRIATISQAELMAVVEPAVAARIERDIKPYLTSYATQWSGAYPFPATFPKTTSAQTAYAGSTSAQSGLLPLNPSATYGWTAGSGSVALVGGTASSISPVSCYSSSGLWRCDFTINPVDLGTNPANWGGCTDPSTGTTYRYCMVNPVIRVRGTASINSGLSFATLPNASEVTSNRSPISSSSISGALSTTGAGTITFQTTYGYTRYRSTVFTRTMRIFIPALTASSLTTSSATETGWFITQQWYRQTYYAVSPAYLPGGTGTCNALPATPSCLTVNNLASPNNNKRAILIFTGRTLDSANARPSSSLLHYLEGENVTPDDYIFEHHAGTATTINDRIIVIAP